jgi:hypothetical protein
VTRTMDLGYEDTMRRRDEIEAFFREEPSDGRLLQSSA